MWVGDITDFVCEHEDSLLEGLCMNCPAREVREYGRDEPPEEICPADFDVLDERCIKGDAIDEIGEILRDANESIAEVIRLAKD